MIRACACVVGAGHRGNSAMAPWFVGLLVAGLVALSAVEAPARAADAVTDSERKALEDTLYQYMTQHPDVLLSALRAAEERAKADEDARARIALGERRHDILEDPTSPVAGNPQGDVTIVEFFDYRCPYCKQVEPALEALLREDGNLRLVYKEFPILGKDSVYATRMALAARKQGKYDAFHAAMMAAKGQINEAVVRQVAKSVGVDLDKADGDLHSAEIEDVIKRDNDLAQALDIRGTPAFIIGGELVPGAVDIATMREKIALARKG
jgi:protein-disulfide isomerase